uniref:ABC transporter domain-containing protein n=1 Tax=Picea sitchensis TaxID=3332 RepID=B8LNF9_PICSI|nr:unknown [Picea sitchensis]
MEETPKGKSSSIVRTISDQMEEVAKEVLTPAKRTAIGRSTSELLVDQATKEVLVTRKSSLASLGRTISDNIDNTTVPTTPGARKPPLGRKMQSPRVSGHIPKWKSGQLRIEDELTNAFFEEVALSRASSATSHGLSFSIAGPVVAPAGDSGLINDLQEARLHASVALKKKETESKDVEMTVNLDSELPQRDPPLPICLKFLEVQYKVILQGKPTSILTSSWTEPIFFEKDILYGVSGSIAPGEMLAMMGPSGSGKTTLINLLGGRIQQNVSGSITYNDQPYSKALKRRIGFVTQDDVLFPHLTVRETLTYTALLRLPRTLTKHQREQRAQEVVRELGLERCQDTIIGGNFVRGISGGERKRVCIGCEILIDPSLLFLDEPTSGLDSTTALRIVQMLHDIARAGRTVVSTIHQPSSRLFHKFDKLILLGEGHSIYFGKASDAMEYFSSVGFSPFLAMNPADFLLDLANGNIHDISVPAELENTSHAEAEDNHGDKFPRSLSSHDVLEYLIEAYETNVAPMEKAKLITLNEVTDDLKSSVSAKREWGATWWDQFSILFVRGLKERRHEYLSFLRIAQVFLTALILGLLWWQSNIDTPKGLQDQIGLIFFIAVFWGFFPVFTAIFTFPQERAMLSKERAVDMYRLSAYFMARILSDLPLDLFLPIGFLLIVYFMAHLRMTVTAFLLTMLTTFLSIVASQGLGLAIGAAFMDLKKATTLASVTMMAFMLAGGFFVQRVHPFIKWIRYLSFNYYTYKILLKIQYDADQLYDCSSPSGCKSIATSSSLRGIPLDGGIKEATVMLIMVFGYRLLAYFSLLRMKLRV